MAIDMHDASGYCWHLRGCADGNVIVRYDDYVDSDAKGRFKTSAIKDVKQRGDRILFLTQNETVYVFDINKCVQPQNLLTLMTRFKVNIDY